MKISSHFIELSKQLKFQNKVRSRTCNYTYNGGIAYVERFYNPKTRSLEKKKPSLENKIYAYEYSSLYAQKLKSTSLQIKLRFTRARLYKTFSGKKKKKKSQNKFSRFTKYLRSTEYTSMWGIIFLCFKPRSDAPQLRHARTL